MRLIDADALRQQLLRCVFRSGEGTAELMQADTVLLTLADAPTVSCGIRHCLHCAMAYVDCPRAIELLDGGGPMDIECCSEWTPKEDEA